MIIVVETVYIIRVKHDESNSLPQVSYYGNTGAVEVEVEATKDFYRFQNAFNTYGIFDKKLPFKEKENGKVFLWGLVFLHFSVEGLDDEDGRITISAAGEDASVNVGMLRKQSEDSKALPHKLFFYVEGISDVEVDEITKCIIYYGEDQFEVTMKPL